jgi:sulfopyruvate decarboxylase subunit beta
VEDTLKRIEAIRAIADSSLGAKALIISNIGYASRELYFIRDRPNNFYMLGSMGLASSLGLGLSLACKEKEVIVVDGDGSILMNLGSLATIANFGPSNLHVIIIDNHVHGSAGNQRSHTAMRSDLVRIARGAGIDGVVRVGASRRLRHLLSEKMPAVVIVDCEPSNADVPIIPLSAEGIKKRFMKFARESKRRSHVSSGAARDAPFL